MQVQNLISSGDLTRKLNKAREAMANEAQPIASDPNAKYILIRTKDTSRYVLTRRSYWFIDLCCISRKGYL